MEGRRNRAGDRGRALREEEGSSDAWDRGVSDGRACEPGVLTTRELGRGSESGCCAPGGPERSAALGRSGLGRARRLGRVGGTAGVGRCGERAGPMREKDGLGCWGSRAGFG